MHDHLKPALGAQVLHRGERVKLGNVQGRSTDQEDGS